jgi:RNA polymerase sigma-70 factor (ECF subfamily)
MSIEKKIIQGLKEGDVVAFDHIYHIYSKKLFHYVLGLVKDLEIARDLVQEVFICLWEKRDRVDLNLNFDNYIFTITYNYVRKYFRKRAIESKAVKHLARNAPMIFESYDETLIYNELLEIANHTIEDLPPRRKTVYKLSKQEGVKIKEIASKLNISTRTAESHLAKALKYLKQELEGI